jgi:uncharacterized Zn-finger protein
MSTTDRIIEVTAADLPLSCPTPSMPLWCNHPKVAIGVEKTGEAACPYCGAHYKLVGELPKGHH